MKEVKDFKFQVKSVNEDGTFEGYSAVYGNVDLGGDVVEPGAFTKTLSDRKNQSYLLWQHKADRPIGDAQYTDETSGLFMKGSLWLDMPDAKVAHTFLLKSLEKGLPAGLSIGYNAVQRDYDSKGVRHLRELKLYESSIVTVAMNDRAFVTAVKSADDLDEFVERFNAISEEIKSGRALSEASRTRLKASMDSMKQAMDHLSALMTDETGKSAAIHHDTEPEGLHSAIDSLKATLDKFIA
jgi:HK97 family phage prohead protease